jgi:hypothetical protein
VKIENNVLNTQISHYKISTSILASYLEMSRYNDSEIEKMMVAERSKVSRANGFQGCVNFGNGCNFGGFYLATYSPEGYCSECELKYSPDKFHGCCFCGKAIEYGGACWGCEEGLSEWLFNLFYNKNENSRSTNSIFAIATPDETNDWDLWQRVSNGIHCLKDELYKSSDVKVRQLASLDNNWPGFRAENNSWYKPDPFTLNDNIDISDITWDNRSQVLLRELEKKGIYLNQEIQYMCDEENRK